MSVLRFISMLAVLLFASLAQRSFRRRIPCRLRRRRLGPPTPPDHMPEAPTASGPDHTPDYLPIAR